MRKLLLALALVALLGIPAEASILSAFNMSNLLNEVTLTNREVILRSSNAADPAAVLLPGGWFKEVTGLPGDLPVAGDLFVQILDGTTLSVNGAPNIWNQTPTDRFEGYGVAQVQSANFTVITPNFIVGQMSFTTAATDPFSVLNTGAGEMFATYVDIGAGATKMDESTSWQTGVNSVTDGTLWATFGPNVLPSDGGGTTLGYADSTVTIVNGIPSGQAYYGLNVIVGPNPAVVFTGVDDTAHPPVTDTSAYARANFVTNNLFPVNSVWRYQSSDPFAFKAVPEPGSFAVWGLLLGAAVSVGAWRKRKR